MVLVNGLTIDDINAALIALQRSRTEVVGGEKGTTVQNISVSNTSSGGGKNYDLQILQLQNDVKAVDEKIGQVQSETNGRINELSSRLADLQVEQLSWNESNRILTLITAGGDYDVQIPSETVTLSLNSSNELTFTMGVNENNNPQTVKVTLPYIRTTEKGVAGGVASLDSSGRVPYSQLPESAMEFKGEWDASINYPHLEDGTGTNGDFYICSAGGTVNFGTVAEPRNITFYPNDRVIYEGSNAQWFRLPAGEVRTVNGMSGDVVLTASNIMYDSNQTIKQKIDSAAQADWTETDSADPSFIKNKIPIWITSGSADDNMSPIDSVTDGSMRPITSNAVYDGCFLKDRKILLKGQTFATNAYADDNPKVLFNNADSTQNISLTFTDWDSVQSPASLTLNGNQGGEYFIAPNIKATGNVNADTVNAATVNANGYQLKRYYAIDTTGLSTSNFYPVTFAPSDLELDCEIHSPNLGGAAAYNQNYIHFLLIAQGWSDTPKRLDILHYAVYDANEKTIGCIGIGNQSGVNCVWVRGGMLFRFYSNRTPTLRTSNYTYGNEVFTVGTNLYGGSNSQVTVNWTPNGVSQSSFTGYIYGTLQGTAEYANKIRTSAPSSPANGDIWLV